MNWYTILTLFINLNRCKQIFDELLSKPFFFFAFVIAHSKWYKIKITLSNIQQVLLPAECSKKEKKIITGNEIRKEKIIMSCETFSSLI